MTDSYVIPRERVFRGLWVSAARALIAAFACWVLPGISAHAAESTADVQLHVTRLAAEVQAAEDVRAIKRLQRAYGYYVDKGMWEDLAALFTDDAVANYPAGIFVGKDSIRRHLYMNVGGGKVGEVGLGDGRLYNHMNLQPVVHLDPGGETAKGRWRALAMIGKYGTSALWAEGIYEFTYRKEGGVWKIHTLDYYSGFGAPYQTGWVPPESPREGRMRRTLAHPPTAAFAMFPAVYDIPFHYPNPVTGRTDIVPVSASKDPQTVAALSAQEHGMPPAIAAALRVIGPKVEGRRTAALYAPLQPTEPYSGVTVTRDVHYGPHERHVLDVFTATGQASDKRPVVVFIHGGGFSHGAKHMPGSPFYDNVGVWAARHGLVGVTINYRLAPEFQWPSGIEDLTLLTGWLKAHVSTYGGDPRRIYLWGHSAGAAHVGDYLAHAANSGSDPGIAGAILTSGFYILGDKVSIWKDYYGADVSKYATRSSLPGLLKTTTPLLVTYAELDPESFQSDSRALIEARAREGKPVRSVRLVGHSHISETYAVGTGDESLSGPVLDFIHATGGQGATVVKGGS